MNKYRVHAMYVLHICMTGRAVRENRGGYLLCEGRSRQEVTALVTAFRGLVPSFFSVLCVDTVKAARVPFTEKSGFTPAMIAL